MLYLVPTPIGNLQDITFRALEALKSADAVLCEDTRVARKLLSLLANTFGVTFSPKEFIALHEHNQSTLLSKLSPDFFNQNVVYMSDAGMPAISDPGAALVRYAQKMGIEYEVLPGPSALTTAYAASGFHDTKFCFFGFLPHKGKQRQEQLQKALQSESNVVLYESPHRLLKLLQEIAAQDPDRELFLAKELSKMHQKYYLGSAKELAVKLQNESIKGEWVVIIRKSTQKTSILTLPLEELLELDLPKKAKAKLLAKISDKTAKEWYEYLNRSDS